MIPAFVLSALLAQSPPPGAPAPSSGAQPASPRREPISLTIGLGWSSLGPAGGLSVSYWRSPLVVTGRLLHSSAFNLFQEDSDSLMDLSLLAGLGHQGPMGGASLSAGVGLASSDRAACTGGFLDESHCVVHTANVLALPLEAQLFARVGESAGLALLLYANINPDRSLVGSLLALRVAGD